jgi:hypothetical protein
LTQADSGISAITAFTAASRSATIGEALFLVFAGIEDRRLIRRAIGPHRHNPLALGHLLLARADEFQIARRRRRVAFTEFLPDDQAILGQRTHQRHVAFLSLIGPLRRLLLGHDLRRTDVQRVFGPRLFLEQLAQQPTLHPR